MRWFAFLGVLGSLLLSASSKALVIDSFDDGAALLTQSAVGLTTVRTNATVVGGVRSATLELTATSGEVATLDIGGGVATVSTGLDQFHHVALGYGYDLAGNPSSLGLNLANQFIRVHFTFSDLPLRMTVQLFSNNNTTDRADYTLALIGGLYFGTTEDLPVNDFTPTGAFDATNVSQVVFNFESNAPRGANDYELSGFEAVPEPASLAIFGAGVAFLAKRRKRKELTDSH